MAQTNSYAIANDAGLAVRQRLNEVLAALQSSNAGATAPPATRPGMIWLDTSQTPPVVRMRNATDTGWEALLDGGSY
ncbi:hypothetical protein SAMN04490248_12043 [Salinihabitans flavidus]|uniref:Uncharacterized protein n=1 Tax=Salinihabitans flavidus TaxID=569882 RepID=A0A1H8UIF7_9RHOB|nr:hypothetical protein [Salinihabitans flavidus]SEP03022.1 hypothetical protein SAMN04490248_12043 [Salinihabitans flavidus]